jgi:hypothetical protein
VPTTPEAGEPWVVGRRHAPYGFEASGEGKIPYNALPVQVQRFAYRTFSNEPELEYAKFERRVAKQFIGSAQELAAARDLLELQRLWSLDSDWYWASPLLDPEFFRAHAVRLKWPREKLAEYDKNLETLREIAERYSDAPKPSSREMARLAEMVVARWDTLHAVPSTLAAARPAAK